MFLAPASGTGVNVTIPGPPSGYYTPEEFATQLTTTITNGIADAGSFSFGITVTVDQTDPLRFLWETLPATAEAQIVRFDNNDTLAPILGFTGDALSRTVFATNNQSYVPRYTSHLENLAHIIHSQSPLRITPLPS